MQLACDDPYQYLCPSHLRPLCRRPRQLGETTLGHDIRNHGTFERKSLLLALPFHPSSNPLVKATKCILLRGH